MDDDELDELAGLWTERDCMEIAVADAALAYFEGLDICLNRNACKLRLHKLREMLENYRKAKQAYSDTLTIRK